MVMNNLHHNLWSQDAINLDIHSTYRPYPREWVTVQNFGSGASDPGSTFSIVSYNLLASSHQKKNSYLYKGTHPINMDKNIRQMALIDEIFERNADIYCLQEVDERWYQDKLQLSFKKEGFEGFFQKRPCSTLEDGSCIFWRSSRFVLEHDGCSLIKFNKIEGNLFLEKPNEALVVVLKDDSLPSKPRLCVATTHLSWNSKLGIVKLSQLDALFTEIHRMVRKYDATMPTLLCGDFNSTPGSIVDCFIQQGSVDMGIFSEEYFSGQEPLPERERALLRNLSDSSVTSSPTDQRLLANLETIKLFRENFAHRTFALCNTLPLDPILRHPFRLQSAYKYGPDVFTTFHRGCKLTVDFIYFGALREEHAPKTRWQSTLKLEATLKLPIRALLDKGLCVMPDLDMGLASDHLAIAARFRFVRQDST